MQAMSRTIKAIIEQQIHFGKLWCITIEDAKLSKWQTQMRMQIKRIKSE